MSATITKEDIKRIGDALPHGSLKEIATSENFSPAYVGSFFAGEVELSKKNIKLLHAAQAKIRDWNDEQEKLKKSIEKDLTKAA